MASWSVLTRRILLGSLDAPFIDIHNSLDAPFMDIPGSLDGEVGGDTGPTDMLFESGIEMLYESGIIMEFEGVTP